MCTQLTKYAPILINVISTNIALLSETPVKNNVKMDGNRNTVTDAILDLHLSVKQIFLAKVILINPFAFLRKESLVKDPTMFCKNALKQLIVYSIMTISACVFRKWVKNVSGTTIVTVELVIIAEKMCSSALIAIQCAPIAVILRRGKFVINVLMDIIYHQAQRVITSVNPLNYVLTEATVHQVILSAIVTRLCSQMLITAVPPIRSTRESRAKLVARLMSL